MSTGIFGRFEGKNVYKVDLPSYINNKYYEDKLDMYLIGGDLIYNNVIIGHWDGSMVHEWDVRDRKVFYTNNVKPKEKKTEPKINKVEPNYAVQPVMTDFKTMDVDTILSAVYNWKIEVYNN